MAIRKGLEFAGLSYSSARDTVWKLLPQINMVNSSNSILLQEREWESKHTGGSMINPLRGNLTFRSHAIDSWAPNHFFK